ncbi:hypothetical protein [Streptomyces rugosispiralis]|uniref:Uncharacterized protein n=1 Tax=Streptomyces rugosispiralis TaxID=2967341 RepID=A0ABT1V2I9_9ACTN|nr:hypothetical protein [Streptomyces rugosispiralis]MCQ8191603.1 hypothetical protein [Streptomyces rugosispiralis]
MFPRVVSPCRAGTGNRPDPRHVPELPRGLVPAPDGNGGAVPRG